MRVYRLVTGGVLAGLLIGLVGPPAVAAPADQPVTWVVDEGGEASALAAAQESGERVEVLDERTETGQLFANPDGTFTLQEAVTPVRVRRGDRWVPVDTTLVAGPDGTVAPAAVPVPVAFSGGGEAPLVRLGSDGEQLSLSWPDPLPVPVLAGDTATYPEVLPDVDLQLAATAQGFSEVLVVKTRAAAASPALAKIRFDLETTGVTLQEAEGGALVAMDGAGETVFQSPAPQMWDSPAGPARTAAQAGANQSVGSYQLDAGALTVVPDQRLLTDPGVSFPLHIDPDFSAGRTGWTKVFSGKPGQSYWNGGPDGALAKAGRCDWPGCNGIGVARSFFRFDVRRAAGRNVIAAELNIFEEHAPSCGARVVDLSYTGDVGAGTTWNNQPGGATRVASQNVAKGYNASCPAGFVGFNATAAVRAAAQAGAATSVLRLTARDEGDKFGWKRFQSNPTLVVTYNSYPDRPTGLSAEHKGCAVAPNEPYVNPLNPSDAPRGPTLRARVTDPDGGLVRAHFEWYQRGGAKLGEVTTTNATSGSTFAATVPTGTFADGAKASYRVRGFDGRDHGPWSGWCEVTLDRTRPGQPPAVSSATYPENDLGGSVGWTGGFTFSANGVSDVAGYLYDLHSSPSQYIAANRVGGTATGLVTPLDDRPHDLYVRSVDRAGNLSDLYRYHFTPARGTPPVAHWRLEGLAETEVVDSRPQRHDGTIAIGPSRWVTGRHGDAMRFDGGSGHVNTRNGPAVRTDRSFSVAAWVKLERTGDSWQVAVSQDGNRTSGFYLQYASDVRKWSFNLMRSDVDNAAPDRVVSDGLAQVGVWTHLAGSYDQAAGRLRLYVNGVQQSHVGSHTSAWTHPSGTVQLGRVKYNGGHQGYWQGAVDEVRIYDRVLSADEVSRLVATPVVEEVFLPFEEGGGGTAADVSGNFRSAQLGEGVAWEPGLLSEGAVRLAGDTAITTGRPAVRTDQGFMASALVRLDNPDGAQAAVSQDGPRSSGFTLGYWPGTKGWVFAVSTADADDPTLLKVDSSALGFLALPGEWTHLAGVYDAVAGEVRLYVNGELVGTAAGRTTANVDGALVLGRNRLAGAPAAYWYGGIDDVHLWTGVHDDEALAPFLQPVTRRPSGYDGQLNRFVTHGGEHITAAARPPAAYHLEHSLGMFAPAGAESTRMLYMCRVGGWDEFTSADPACEGQEVLGLLGRVYTQRPEDLPVLPIYRCTINGEHFDSHDPECEGRTTEGLLGYALAYTHLIRYASPSSPYDHISALHRVPADYRTEGRLGVVALGGVPGTTPLWGCQDGGDSFVSTDPACEGATVVGQRGRIWTEPPEDRPSHQLFRCRASWGDLFESADPDCEGQTVVGPVGYLVTRL